MERQKAIKASGALAGAVVIGALAFSATSALGDARRDNVGQLQPVASTVTVVIDPATGVATAAAPAATAAAPASDARHAEHDDEHEEDDDD